MKNAINLITPVALMLFFAMSSNAQTLTANSADEKQCNPKACKPKTCDVKNCDPKMCTTLLPGCSKGVKTSTEKATKATENTTKVAAATIERNSTEAPSTRPTCASSTAKKCCNKKEN